MVLFFLDNGKGTAIHQERSIDRGLLINIDKKHKSREGRLTEKFEESKVENSINHLSVSFT